MSKSTEHLNDGKPASEKNVAEPVTAAAPLTIAAPEHTVRPAPVAEVHSSAGVALALAEPAPLERLLEPLSPVAPPLLRPPAEATPTLPEPITITLDSKTRLRLPSLEEAKETGAALVLPPVVETALTGWSLEPEPVEFIEPVVPDSDLISHITIEEVLAESGLLSHESSSLESTAIPTLELPEMPQLMLGQESFAEFVTGQADEQAEQTEPLTPELLVAAVSERLAAPSPEQKEAALPIVQELTEAIAEVQALRSLALPVESSELAKAEARVYELSVALLEVLGVEHDDESLRLFVQRLITMDASALRRGTTEAIDLERMGTHEAKRHFPQFFTTLADLLADRPAGYWLGKFALLRESITSELLDQERIGSGSVAA